MSWVEKSCREAIAFSSWGFEIPEAHLDAHLEAVARHKPLDLEVGHPLLLEVEQLDDVLLGLLNGAHAASSICPTELRGLLGLHLLVVVHGPQVHILHVGLPVQRLCRAVASIALHERHPGHSTEGLTFGSR